MSKNRNKIGLVMGGGAARGLSYIGVIKELEKANIPIDFICGTSIGALIGGMYASTKDIKLLEKIALETDWKKLVSLVDLANLTQGIIQGNKIEKFINKFLNKKTFKETFIPLKVISTDVKTGTEKVFSSGKVLPAIRASISIPYIFKTYAYNNSYYVDGGMVNPLPINHARTEGLNLIIAVSAFGKKMKNSNNQNNNKHPNIFDITFKSILIMQYSLAKEQLKFSDINIFPNVSKYSWKDFYKAKELIAEGEIAARKSIPKILDKLKENKKKTN